MLESRIHAQGQVHAHERHSLKAPSLPESCPSLQNEAFVVTRDQHCQDLRFNNAQTPLGLTAPARPSDPPSSKDLWYPPAIPSSRTAEGQNPIHDVKEPNAKTNLPAKRSDGAAPARIDFAQSPLGCARRMVEPPQRGALIRSAAQPAIKERPAEPPEAHRAKGGGAGRDRTDDLKLAKLALSQLSYGPVPEIQKSPLGFFNCSLNRRWAGPTELRPRPRIAARMVGPGRFELPTSRLSSARSNQLSYEPPWRWYVSNQASLQ